MKTHHGYRTAGCVFAAVGLALLNALPAQAQQGRGQGPVAQACAADIGKFCEGLTHGGGKVRACLEANKDKVSAQCSTALATHGPGRGQGQGGGGGMQ